MVETKNYEAFHYALFFRHPLLFYFLDPHILPGTLFSNTVLTSVSEH
jgi:hypothetical protein